ncbi:MAG: Unknown protein [uncultured Sulfurovum sp.]|uniref:Porin domain-containing protein n=1 Tax=uncultured Sulfurovum sp. TaxID=269237 RepID=A0A6S6TUI0_9BACT|nr:MAG: Unknown protein [uncultured Sulfurovum sp.]
MESYKAFKCNHKGENVKITKLSLAAIAAMTITTGAMAENTANFSGNVKLWYETADTDGGVDNSLFHKNSTNGFSSGDAAASLEVKGKAGVLGYGVKYTAVDSLGLEGNLVSSRRATGTDANGLNTAHWAEKAFITYKMGNTTAKIGRQHLNTPLAFTETWNVAANSFDAVVLMNNDIENVTLMGSYVGKHNGYSAPGSAAAGNGFLQPSATFGTVTQNGKFETFGASGAYVAAALAKPVKDLGINAWYYNIKEVADAAWVDADYKIGPVMVGALYAQMMPNASGVDDTTAFAIKAGSKVGPVSLFAAYSDVSDDGVLLVGNVATGGKKTQLPTAGVYNDGFIVAAPGAKSFKLKASYPVSSVNLTAQYMSTTNDNASGSTPNGALGREVDEIDLIAATKIADVNVKAIYVNRTFGTNGNNGIVLQSDSNHVRIIAGINF